MRSLKLALGVALLMTGAVSADGGAPAMPAHTMVAPGEIVWGPAPPGLPPGSKAALLQGNPGEKGSFTLRAWLPKGYKVPPHWHATIENLTVISGGLRVGMTDSLDAAKGTLLVPGAFATMAADMHHWIIAESETILQVHGEGPFAITYVNPADDPRNQPVQTK